MLKIEGLQKTFGPKKILDGLTFSVSPGEIYGLLGPNGAGKTTSINILCRFLDADGGSIRVNGEPVSEETKKWIGIAPQEISVYKDLTCRENLHFFATLYGMTGKKRKNRVDELIRSFQLEEYANTETSRLSGGWQRRMNIAVALVHSPRVLVLDEPTTGLDVEARYEVWQWIERLKKEGITTLLTSHYLQEVERLCTRIGILQQGRIAASGTLDELRRIVPAVNLAAIESEEEGRVCEKARSLGWTERRYGGKLTFWMPEHMALKEIVDAFGEIRLTSVSVHPVGLEHVYTEVTREGSRQSQNGLFSM